MIRHSSKSFFQKTTNNIKKVVRVLTRHNPIIRQIRFAHYRFGYFVLSKFVKPINGRVVFLSNARTDFTGNFLFLKEELERLRRHKDSEFMRRLQGLKLTENLEFDYSKLETVEILSDFSYKRYGIVNKIVGFWNILYLMVTAKVILLDDFYARIYTVKFKKETKIIQLWHAVGAFKKIGHSLKGSKEGGPGRFSIIHKNYSYAIVSSPQIIKDYANAFKIDESKVIATGIPRTDAFFNKELILKETINFKKKYGISLGKKIILFAPTFRGFGQANAFYDYNGVDWEFFDVTAQKLGYQLVVKMHPFVPSLFNAKKELSKKTSIIDISESREINKYLMASDVLITDYSSIIFEFALMNKPIIFYCPDLREYEKTRNFYYPFCEYQKIGQTTQTTNEIAQVLESIEANKKQNKDLQKLEKTQINNKEFINKFVSACTGHSTQNVIKELIIPFL